MADEIIDGMIALEVDADGWGYTTRREPRTDRNVWHSALDLTEFGALRERRPCVGRESGLVKPDEFYACEYPERTLLPVPDSHDWVLSSWCPWCQIVVLALLENAVVGNFAGEEWEHTVLALTAPDPWARLGRDLEGLDDSPLKRMLVLRFDRLARAISEREGVV